MVEMPVGDVVDRVTILLLKVERLSVPAAIGHARAELTTLESAWAAAGLPPMRGLAEWSPLCAVNAALWDVEDQLRLHERALDFGDEFIGRARSVYRLNDQRAVLKRAVSMALGSRLVEEKSYAQTSG